MNANAALAVLLLLGGAAIYQASNWWERAYATLKSSELSPDGCIRIDTYEPFWITPSIFHRIPHPDPEIRNDLGTFWTSAIFSRAYEVSTGTFLGKLLSMTLTSPTTFLSGPPRVRRVGALFLLTGFH